MIEFMGCCAHSSDAFKYRAANDDRDGAMLQLDVVEIRQPLMIS
jgi:hypothetical protein